MRLRKVGMSSATWDMKMCDTAEVEATAGSGSSGYKLLISCFTCALTGTGGAFLAAAGGHPRSQSQEREREKERDREIERER